MTLLLQAKNIGKSFGVQQIFREVTFQIHSGDKIGLVGPNGAGKSTLLGCITGEEQDVGEITCAEGLKIVSLSQMQEFASGTTLFEFVLEVFAELIALREALHKLENEMSETHAEALDTIMHNYSELTERYERSGGFSCESKVRKICSGLGFSESDLSRDLVGFSGGEKTRAGLARLLAMEPDLMLLDEPTNHLDLAATEWLENYLSGYQGTTLIISHDRYFLDRTTSKTFDLEQKTLVQYPGNYTRYLFLKEESAAAQAKAYEKQHKKIQATEAYIERYRAGIKSKQARGRQSQLDRQVRLEKPLTGSSLNLGQKGRDVEMSGTMIIEVDGLTWEFPERCLFDQISFQIKRGEKVALIGRNGAGKSTLLKLITGQEPIQSGSIRLGSRLKTVYYDQEHAGLDLSLRVIDEIMYNFGMGEAQARDLLGPFLFQGDHVFKAVRDLSGGEKGRLSFLKMLLAKPNFMILDEPTNHLDIQSKDVIEGYLQEYQGTILAVSHDRYFLDKIANRIIELREDGLHNFPGSYTFYREKCSQDEQTRNGIDRGNNSSDSVGSRNNQNRNKDAAKEQSDGKPKLNKAKTRLQIEQLEQEIDAMETRLHALSEQLADPTVYQNEEIAREVLYEYKEVEAAIPQRYSEWERLSELLS